MPCESCSTISYVLTTPDQDDPHLEMEAPVSNPVQNPPPADTPNVARQKMLERARKYCTDHEEPEKKCADPKCDCVDQGHFEWAGRALIRLVARWETEPVAGTKVKWSAGAKVRVFKRKRVKECFPRGDVSLSEDAITRRCDSDTRWGLPDRGSRQPSGVVDRTRRSATAPGQE